MTSRMVRSSPLAPSCSSSSPSVSQPSSGASATRGKGCPRATRSCRSFPPPPMESRHLYWCRRHHHVCPHQENKSRHAQTLHVHEEGQRGTEGLIVVWSTATFLLPHHRLSCSPCSHSDSHHPRWRTTSQGVPCRHNHLQHCPKHIPRQSLTSHAQQKRHPNPEPLLVN